MIRRTLLAVAAFAAATAAQAQPPMAGQGFAIAKARCAACHALTGVDEPPRSGAPPFADIGRRFPGPALEARLSLVLRQGHYAMPPRRLGDAERAAIGAFIRDSADRAAPEGIERAAP